MSNYQRLLSRWLSDGRHYHDYDARASRAIATLKRCRPELSGRVGKIERAIARITIMGDRDWTTAELAREIYAHPTWDQDFQFRDGKPAPKLKSWMYHRVRLAAPTFCDPVGRSTTKGNPYLWRPRPGVFFSDVRDWKRARDAERRRAKSDRNG
jgi:hypothetical protein